MLTWATVANCGQGLRERSSGLRVYRGEFSGFRFWGLGFRVYTPSIPLNTPYNRPLYNPLYNPFKEFKQ